MTTPGKPLRWSLALLITVLALAAWLSILLQFWFMQPFKAQTAVGLSIAAFLRDAAPIMALACLVLVLAASAMLWAKARTVARVMLVGAGLVTLAATLVARLNAFERMFAPMPEPRFVAAEAVDFIGPDDMVLAVRAGDDAVAYPVRLLAYHHLVHDRVGEKAIVATY